MERFRSAACGALLALSVALPLPAAAASGPVVTLAEHGRTIPLARGETLTLRLEANGTTGYQWEIASLPPNVRRLGERYEAPPQGRGPSPVVGAGGDQIFTFRAAAAGRGTLRLVYRQPWNRKERPEQSFRLVVVTR